MPWTLVVIQSLALNDQIYTWGGQGLLGCLNYVHYAHYARGFQEGYAYQQQMQDWAEETVNAYLQDSAEENLWRRFQ